MARRFHPRSTPAENFRIVMHSIPWKLLFLVPVLVVVAVPTYLLGAHVGNNVLPNMTNFFYTAFGASAPTATPTPPPPFPTLLPQAGSVLYTVENGDSCDSILTFQMHMNDAGQVFSDVKPETVHALNAALGHDCHKLQPGMVLPLSPHYPLIAFGGLIKKIEATTPQQVLPTPLINVPDREPLTADCSGGCILTVQLTDQVAVRLSLETTLTIREGAWIWTDAMMARKAVRGFGDYPYADPLASFNNMSLRACNFEINNQRDPLAASCDDLTPNTIDDDGGSWLLGVTGSSALDHWRYPLHLPPNTRVLLWLSSVNGNLKFQPGNAVYRYDETAHLYQKV
jgi:hypothetical protein